MNFTKLILLSVPVLLLNGCASMQLETDSTAFYTADYNAQGSISVVASNADVNDSLEFAAYKQKFEGRLAHVGYQVVQDADQADFIALVAYGIDHGKTSNITTPIFGQTGGGASYSSGTINTTTGNTSYTASSYRMPTYGVVGAVNSTSTVYNRAIAMDIVVAKSLKSGKVQKVYEGRTKSLGSCSVIVEVFDEMLEAMFSGFPGENGRNRQMRIAGEFNC
ncbi:MAG: DUF4136 domain-containing protein [Gammaproteobacteria bacterium]|nr:DUF4136 domain-containing protein [Gammaproteobacteria bacterium]MBL6999038.1 DUF4136 domain-containing protein [Gammaproteobacteria bacterium]